MINQILTSLVFISTLSLSNCSQKNADNELTTVQEIKSTTEVDLSNYSKATFAAGCFWCEEAIFESIKGVEETISGYAGGTEPNPTYEKVGRGQTGHAEAVEVYYDSTVVSYADLLKVYFASIDPTQVNGQGPDMGAQYRSIIFYRNQNEKLLSIEFISKLNASKKYNKPIAVEVVPFDKFWTAEAYHQDYVLLNPNQSYVRFESIPRLRRTQEQVPELLKPERSIIQN